MPPIKKEIEITQYLSEKKDEIFEFINEHKRVLLNANPASGKTTLFADLCIEHSKNNKSGRIIFCCPFLIIQEQFKERLESSGIQINFELNGKSSSYKLHSSHKIITSTFHSFYKISNQLNKNDIIIVDEAHAILFKYPKSPNSYTYFTKFSNSIYKSDAKLILMSGTSKSALSALFNLSELKIKRNEIPSKINIQFSNEKDSNIVLAFAELCLKSFDHTHLNIIYIKNKTKCYLFRDLIEQTLHVKALTLTSLEKDSEDYKTLITKSIIPLKYQFLITTNVISTGTNILNQRIGKALMLNENNPSEIKQFCKRFRRKKDIEVDVINPIYDKPEIDLKEERKYWTDQRDEIRKVYKKLLKSLKKIKVRQEEYDTVEYIEYNNHGSSPNQMINSCLEQFLIQEIYFDSQINFTYKSEEELIDALNEFDDIISLEISQYNEHSSGNYLNEKEIIDSYKKEKNNLLDGFLKLPEQHLKVISNYLIDTADLYLQYLLKSKIDLSPDIKVLDTSIKDKICNRYFINEILFPFLDYYPHFNDMGKTIYFMKITEPNKRNPLKVSLYFNKKFHEFFDIEKIINKNKESTLHLVSKKPPVTPTDKFTLKFLRYTFDYLVMNDYMNYKDFKKYLLEKDIKLPTQLNTPMDFPFDLIRFNKKSSIILTITQNFAIGLARSIFKLETKQKQRYDKDRVRKPAYLFTEKIVETTEKMNMFLRTDMLREQDNSKLYEYSCITKIHDGYNFNKSKRVLIDSYGLINNVLDQDFYKTKTNRFFNKFLNKT